MNNTITKESTFKYSLIKQKQNKKMQTDTTHHAIHIAQVVGANAVAWSLALSNINTLLTTLSLVLATSYTIYKWLKELKK